MTESTKQVLRYTLSAVLFIIVLLVIFAAQSEAQAFTRGQAATSLSGVAVTGAGSDFAVLQPDSQAPTAITWTSTFTGTPTAINVNLEGSIDHVKWFVLDTSTSTSDEMRHVVYKPVLWLRCNITSYTVNASTETCKFIAGKQ